MLFLAVYEKIDMTLHDSPLHLKLEVTINTGNKV